MATTQSYSTTKAPSSTHYFAGGDATNWCVITPPPSAKTVTITNREGAFALYAAINGRTSVTGAASATHANAKIIPAGVGNAVTISLRGEGSNQAVAAFSVWGAAGAAHAMDFLFDGVY